MLFPNTYHEGRQTFLDYVSYTGGKLKSYPHPMTDPDNKAIALDVATWGQPNATNVLVIISGTHGIEGFAGSGIQSTLLAEDLTERIGDKVQLVMIHAINPYGFAWQRRVNEDNVDLNRNFINHNAPHPVNKGYASLAELLAPRKWSDKTAAEIKTELNSRIAQHGIAWVKSAITSGQYEFVDGLFYGGLSPTWSNRTMYTVATQYLKDAQKVLVIDIHTGLGRYGEAEYIVEYPTESEHYHITRKIWGDLVRSTVTGDSQSTAVSGSLIAGLTSVVGSHLVGIGLEFGTVEMTQAIMAILADQWLHHYGSMTSDKAKTIKSEMRQVFYPNDAAWREAIMHIARKVVNQSLAYLL